jgi:regulator of protease activity HflC (stomatin/prohibitin superfamily)
MWKHASMFNTALPVVAILVFLLIVIIAKSVRIVQEYERGVIFRLGRCVGAKGPGIFFIVPVIDKIIRVNLQTMAVPVQPQQVITKDNVTVVVDAVAYFQVVDPVASVIKVNGWYGASQLVAQTTLRAIIGRHELDQLLSERDRIDSELRDALDAQTEQWGIKVHRVEIRDVQLPENMQRAMAKQAEAERERRSKIIAAEGELQASQMLADAARTMATAPGAMHLRTLQTLAEVAVEKNSTLVFPIPSEVMDAFRAVAHHFGPSEPASTTPPLPAPPAP